MKIFIKLIFFILITFKSFAETKNTIYEKIDLFSEVLKKIDQEYFEEIKLWMQP